MLILTSLLSLTRQFHSPALTGIVSLSVLISVNLRNSALTLGLLLHVLSPHFFPSTNGRAAFFSAFAFAVFRSLPLIRNMSFSRSSARAVKQALRAPSVAKRSIALAARQQGALNAAVQPQVARNVLGVSEK